MRRRGRGEEEWDVYLERAVVLGDWRRRLREYFRVHEGMSAQKAGKEAGRIVKLLWQAHVFYEDKKRTLEQVRRIVESADPEAQSRRQRAAGIAARAIHIRDQLRATGRLTKGISRWISEIVRGTKTVRPPSERRLKYLEKKLERLEVYLGRS
jgi:hypothetical protein